MKRVVAFPLDAGGAVLIEVDDESNSATARSLRSGELSEKIVSNFEGTLEAIKHAAVSVASNFRNLADAPAELEVQFGIKLSGQAGAFIASASTEAQFQVKIVWKWEQQKQT